MLAIFFVRAVILVQTEHVNDNFQELLRFCLFLVSWLEDFCKDLVEISEKLRGEKTKNSRQPK
jgi:hypothetical protein